MQDEFIEREYLKLKQQAMKADKGDNAGVAYSQQYSEKGIQGLN